MNWEIEEDSLRELPSGTWYCIICINQHEGVYEHIADVNGKSSEECLERAKLICKAPQMYNQLTKKPEV